MWLVIISSSQSLFRTSRISTRFTVRLRVIPCSATWLSAGVRCQRSGNSRIYIPRARKENHPLQFESRTIEILSLPRRTKVEQIRERDLMMAQEVRQMPESKMILLVEGQRPIYGDKLRFFNTQPFKSAEAYSQSHVPDVPTIEYLPISPFQRSRAHTRKTGNGPLSRQLAPCPSTLNIERNLRKKRPQPTHRRSCSRRHKARK